MGFNAWLTGLFAVALCIISCRLSPSNTHSVLTCALAILFCLPFAWENTLEGFGSQFIFLALFSLVAIDLLARTVPFSIRWYCGVLAAISACFSMGSGFFCGISVIGVYALRAFRARRLPLRSEIPSIIVASGVVLGGALLTVRWSSSESARTIHAFRLALLANLAWPNVHSQVSAFLLWLPSIFLIGRLLYSRDEQYREELIAGFICWVFLQSVAIASSRGLWGNIPVSRYMDCLSCGSICNVLALVQLFRHPDGRRWKILVGLIWAVPFVFGLCQLTAIDFRAALPNKRAQTTVEASNVRAYLETKDRYALRAQKLYDIPYPDADRLAELLDDSLLTSVLPTDLQPEHPPGPISSIPRDGTFSAPYRWLLNKSEDVTLTGVLLLILAVAGRARPVRRHGTVASAE